MAAKQCERNSIPKVNEIKNIKNIEQIFVDYDLILVAYEKETKNLLKKEIQKLKKTYLKIAVIIGPEGGFEEEEIKKLQQINAKVITLGKRILRTETVPIVVTSILMYELEI